MTSVRKLWTLLTRLHPLKKVGYNKTHTSGLMGENAHETKNCVTLQE